MSAYELTRSPTAKQSMRNTKTRRSSKLTRTRQRAALFFLLPMAVAVFLVAAWPLGRTIYFSFTDAALLSLETHEWVGFSNYLFLATDPDWWRSVRNTLVFTIVSVSLETVLGVAIALALHSAMPGRGLLRAAVLIPWAIPTVVSAQMWLWMFNDIYGVINHLLLAVGLISEAKAWTADPALVMPALIIVDVWKTTPFMALLTLAALQTLPQECYEAARVDGVNPFKVFWKVTLPLIRPALMVGIIFRSLDALRVFDLMYVMTGNNKNTATMSVYARENLIDFQDVGYGSAVSTALFFTIALLTILFLRVGRVRLTDQGY